ncbi:putative hydroxypyruvate isomerase isoform X2 [Dendronephthya gigantea]|uniref:putative hydroxypyruvate isomerase isoform X2 n=1 Tax=Dendronephthya gigantea TaxID=151771 RepID=UPI00106D4A1C|nr:putative hydroxypyruvate isomerase isoform X2 [Dendronephthya gigantea]
MSLKVDANISFMFKEWPNFIDRYKAASEAGFKAVESGDEVYQYAVDEIKKAKSEANVQQIVMVGYGGTQNTVIGIPGKEVEFRQSFTKSLEYALALKCGKIHVCSGVTTSVDSEEVSYSCYEDIYIRNLRHCSEEARKVGIKILIEPITTIPGYFLTNTMQGIEILKKLNCDNVKLEFDFFHAQRAHGNLTKTLKDNIQFIGHIQVSQVPDRGEPSSSGEINFEYIFKLIHKLGYNQWIGGEYNPTGRTGDGLDWINYYGLEF